jgi:hypothetical protein
LHQPNSLPCQQPHFRAMARGVKFGHCLMVNSPD